MKKLLVLTVGLMLVAGLAFATWDDANSKGLFPYWQTGGAWYTLLTFVNGSEETPDVIYIRFCDEHGNFASTTTGDAFSIREKEMLLFCTIPGIGTNIAVTAPYGYVKFRVQDGGFIHAWEVIYNSATGAGYVVPPYHQDSGF